MAYGRRTRTNDFPMEQKCHLGMNQVVSLFLVRIATRGREEKIYILTHIGSPKTGERDYVHRESGNVKCRHVKTFFSLSGVGELRFYTRSCEKPWARASVQGNRKKKQELCNLVSIGISLLSFTAEWILPFYCNFIQINRSTIFSLPFTNKWRKNLYFSLLTMIKYIDFEVFFYHYTFITWNVVR